MAPGIHVERAMFMIGDQNTGKSTQLRSMFLDWRLGNQGRVPTANRLRNGYALSNERWLYLRLTSPHEAGETLDEFFYKCAAAMQAAGPLARRWNFAGALQPTSTSKLPNGPDVIARFIRRFPLERVRAVILSPDRAGNHMPPADYHRLMAALRAHSSVEIVTTDATTRTGNGLICADFLDFT